MRNIAGTICLAVLLPVTLLFGGVYFSKEQYHIATWWFFATLLIAGLGGTLLVAGQTPVVRVTIKNTGKTPAVDVMVGARVQIGDFPLFTDTKYEAIDAPRVTLGAEQSATVDISADHPLTEDELAGLNSGMKWLKAHTLISVSS